MKREDRLALIRIVAIGTFLLVGIVFNAELNELMSLFGMFYFLDKLEN